MITFQGVTKQFRDGPVAVDDLSLEVPEGTIVALVGPSGSGKTTTMRMVNRLIEPTRGQILLGGRDVMDIPPAELRRGIGYVIQQIGLFPHRTTAQNIATVPELLGWSRAEIDARVAELLELTGLPESVAGRYPHELSGGQRQRVGVARALASDPPVMLMDEPFGAVDPILRSRLQQEFLRLQAEMRKTILFVTHDIDEALLIGDHIAILAAGRLEQYDTPETILAEPANEFVEDFLGPERGLKRLALIPVERVKADSGPMVRPEDDRTRAEQVASVARTDWVVVVTEGGHLVGWAWVRDIGDRVGDATIRDFWVRMAPTDSLRAALDAMVRSRTGVAVRVDPDGRYEGMLTQELLTGELLL